MTQNQIRKIVAFIFQSHGKRLYVPPEQWNIILPLVHYDILKNKYGFPKSRIGAETDQQITDSLLPFISTPTTIALTAGTGTLPADYLHLLTCDITNAKYVDIITKKESSRREGNSVIVSSTRYPTLTLYNGQVRVKPTSITSIQVVYIKKLTAPTTPTFAYTIANGVITYNESSVQFQWGEEHDIDIIRGILEYLGITMSEGELLPYLQLKKQEEN